MRRITGKGRVCDDLPVQDWKDFVSRDELLKKQITEINSRYNKRINLIVPMEVKRSISRLMGQARWIGRSTKLRQFGEELRVVIPGDVRERVSALRRARHREMQLVMRRHYRTIMSVHNRSLLVRNIANT